MRIAIVMTAYNREPLLRRTLQSLKRYNPNDFVVVLDRDKDSPEKTWVNSAIAYNRAFYEVLHTHMYTIDAVIIQNAECYHAGDIIGYVETHLTDENYIAFPCYSLAKDDTCPPIEMNNRCATHDGDSAWYNHPVHRPVGYHFCAAITANNLRKLNGFDERFMYGHDYEDNYWLHQVKSLGLRIDIPAEPYVFHQWHYSSNRPRGTGNNEALFHELSRENNYRAVHLITKDL